MWTSWSSGGYVVEVLGALTQMNCCRCVHCMHVCCKVKVCVRPGNSLLLNPPSTETFFFFVWMRPLLFGQWRYYTQKIGRSLSRSLWKSIESTLSLSCDSYVYNILFNLHHTHREREREWMSADIVILFRFVERAAVGHQRRKPISCLYSSRPAKKEIFIPPK